MRSVVRDLPPGREDPDGPNRLQVVASGHLRTGSEDVAFVGVDQHIDDPTEAGPDHPVDHGDGRLHRLFEGRCPQRFSPQIRQCSLALHPLTPIGDIAGVEDHAIDIRIGEQVPGDTLQPPPRSVLVEYPHGEFDRFPGKTLDLAESGPQVLDVCLVNQAVRRVQEHFGLITQHLGARRTGIGDPTVSAHDEHQVRRALHQRPETALAAFGQRRRILSVDQRGAQRPIGEDDSDPHQDGQPVHLRHRHQRRSPTEGDQSLARGQAGQCPNHHGALGGGAGHHERFLPDEDQTNGQRRPPPGGVDRGRYDDRLGQRSTGVAGGDCAVD